MTVETVSDHLTTGASTRLASPNGVLGGSRADDARPDQAKDVEQRIERLHLEDGDGDHHVDFEKVPQGWIRMEQLLDEAGVAASPELHRSVVQSLGREVRDHATTYLTTTDIRVDGVTPAELVAWLRPLLDEDQDSITVDGQGFDLNPEE